MIEKGTLYIVATPIGNLADLTPRAIEVLTHVDCIAAEDTRHSGKLLAHFSIKTRMLAYHDHNDQSQTQKILDILKKGQSVALISDAGTPLISDPGYRLVNEASKQAIKVSPIPGACALIAGLSVAGLPTDKFSFEGFVPAKEKARLAFFEQMEVATHTTIFYESVHRITASMEVLSGLMPNREIVLARELTKTYETIVRGPVFEVFKEISGDHHQVKGEFVLILAGQPAREDQELSNEVIKLLELLMQELPLKKAAALVSQYTGAKKNKLYRYGLDVTNN